MRMCQSNGGVKFLWRFLFLVRNIAIKLIKFRQGLRLQGFEIRGACFTKNCGYSSRKSFSNFQSLLNRTGIDANSKIMDRMTNRQDLPYKSPCRRLKTKSNCCTFVCVIVLLDSTTYCTFDIFHALASQNLLHLTRGWGVILTVQKGDCYARPDPYSM